LHYRKKPVRVAILAALPQELAPLIERLRATREERSRLFDIYFATDRSTEIILVITGMGSANAQAAISFICKSHCPDIVLSAGYGGALYPGAVGGELIWADNFFAIRETDHPENLKMQAEDKIIDRIARDVSIKHGVIITVPGFMKKAEIITLVPENIENPVCDMETYPIAHSCAGQRIRFIAIRSITDLYGHDIPAEIAGIVDKSGQYSIFRALRTMIRRPLLLPTLLKLGIYSRRASRNLKDAVMAFLDALH
jgi:adenosylhomocysteine nucleosidase